MAVFSHEHNVPWLCGSGHRSDSSTVCFVLLLWTYVVALSVCTDADSFPLAQDLQSVRTVTAFNGPEFQPYTVTSNVGIESLVWSSCGVNWPLNIGTAVAVQSINVTEDSGFIENDTDDGTIQFIAGVQWQRCK